MNKKPESSSLISEGRMKLIALLMYVADQKQKSVSKMEQLFARLRLPRRN